MSPFENYDLLIRGCRVIDGTGKPAFAADVGVRDGRIVAVGDLRRTEASRVIDSPGSVLCPGFIDIHSHSDFAILINPRAESKVRQGVTTEVIGNCGSSAAPLCGEKLARARGQNKELNIDWRTLGEYRKRVEEQGTAVNLVPLTGQGNIRASVMGYDRRPPTRSEMSRMLALLEQEIEEGSRGISTGLVYPPGVFTGFSELVKLLSRVAASGGIYATHLRNESGRVEEAVEEAIRLSEESGVSLQISHLKAQGSRNWSRIDGCFQKIEAARERGLNVHCDRYPYIASATDLDILLPDWTWEGGEEEELRRISDPSVRRRIRQEIIKDDWESVVISRVSTAKNRSLEGKNLEKIAVERGLDPVDCFIDILREERLKVEALFFGMSPQNLDRILRKPYCLIGSDASARADYGPLSRGKPHPRTFGTFPRVLGILVRRGPLSLEEAVHKMTGLPARKLGLPHRGIIREAAAADLVIFNPDRIRDRATYQEPKRYPEGIEYVLVNGEIVVDHGEHTGKLPGMVLEK
ncbi:MAG: D-aminoacylase [Candidatus Euphemobacter frigidus]|nr:D-aminoacylase [Candidatus Euphemobacter frigidus]MDP8275361.1 D-aminoacylase [Candidatus Euphemobacter frigidus]